MKLFLNTQLGFDFELNSRLSLVIKRLIERVFHSEESSGSRKRSSTTSAPRRMSSSAMTKARMDWGDSSRGSMRADHELHLQSSGPAQECEHHPEGVTATTGYGYM